MFSNHLRIAIRSIKANKLFSAISILGLTMGITVCFSIFLLVRYELSFNQTIPDKERIYRLNTIFSGIFSGSNRGVQPSVASFVEDNLSGFELVAPFHNQSLKITLQNGDQAEKKFDYYDNIILADKRYFDMVGLYNWLAGDEAQALSSPFQLVLVASRAKTYFGDIPYTDMMGKKVVYNDSLTVVVSGIVEDTEALTDFNFTDFISYSTIPKSWLAEQINDDNWGSTSSSSQLFVKAAAGVPVATLKEQIKLIEKKRDEVSPDKYATITYALQPLSDLHFDTELGVFDNTYHDVEREKLYILLLIGVMILIIAAINFINLETAQASQRAKEIGVRKVMGASQSHIVWQFMMQSMLVTTIATMLALPLLQPFYLLMADFIPKGLKVDLTDPFLYTIVATTILLIGVGSGLYPAFVMSRFQPVQAMKSQVYSSGGKNYSAWLRKGLTVFQFGFAQILIVFTFIAILQMRYIEQHDLGFDAANRIFLQTPWDISASKREAFNAKLATIPHIELISSHNSSPATQSYTTSMAKRFDSDSVEQSISVHWMATDKQYFDFYGLKFIAGRPYEAADNLQEIVVNESFTKSFGIKNQSEALGMSVDIGTKKYIVVGVIGDFHFKSLHHAIDPHAFYYRKANFAVGIKLAEGQKHQTQQTLDEIEKVWKEMFIDSQFTYSFVSDQLENFYSDEREMSKLIYIATGLAILISCMGLFGLASFTVAQRTKEIGIRKVLGASVNQVIRLVSADFVKLVLIAFVIAAPIGYYLGKGWLDNFAYHYEIGIWVFVTTVLITVVIAIVTLLYQTLSCANANPINALRNE